VIHFVVHDENDSEGVKAGQDLTGWIMDQDKEITVCAQSNIPIGHKLAIRELKSSDTVIKYSVDIGRTIAPIKVGEHAHVHNIKTKRW
jgi:(2R)-sulfolactate sulfo-lyase subunit alpha